MPPTLTTAAPLTAAGSLLTAAVSDRTLTYRLVPYGEAGRTTAGLLTIQAGAITVPDELGTVTLNLEHDPTRPVGRLVQVSEDAQGLVAVFHVAATTAGDDLLAEAAEGLRPGASVELAEPVIRGGVLQSARLVAAGAVVRPAFPSALLVASDTPAPDSDPTPPPDGPDAADPDDEDDDDTTTGEDDDMPDTPAVVTASAPPELTTTTTRPAVSLPQVAGLLAAYSATRDPGLLRAMATPDVLGASLFATLTDIPYDGTGGLAPTMTQPAWLGELWSGVAFTRRIVPLFNHGDLTSLDIAGWRWKTKPAVAPWAGNKTPVPSNPAEVEPYTTRARRLAGAWDIAREYRDFSVPGFWEGFFAAGVESYARQSDAGVLADVLTAATDVVGDAVPDGVPVALSLIVDGALSFIDTAPATFAVVAADLWRALAKTPTDKSLQFLSVSLSLAEGTASSFPIVPSTTLPAGSVLVGARNAATVHELPGSPVRASAENLAAGGLDEGLFGYYGTVVHDGGALAHVTSAPDVPLAAGRKG